MFVIRYLLSVWMFCTSNWYCSLLYLSVSFLNPASSTFHMCEGLSCRSSLLIVESNSLKYSSIVSCEAIATLDLWREFGVLEKNLCFFKSFKFTSFRRRWFLFWWTCLGKWQCNYLLNIPGQFKISFTHIFYIVS